VGRDFGSSGSERDRVRRETTLARGDHSVIIDDEGSTLENRPLTVRLSLTTVSPPRNMKESRRMIYLSEIVDRRPPLPVVEGEINAAVTWRSATTNNLYDIKSSAFVLSSRFAWTELLRHYWTQ